MNRAHSWLAVDAWNENLPIIVEQVKFMQISVHSEPVHPKNNFIITLLVECHFNWGQNRTRRANWTSVIDYVLIKPTTAYVIMYQFHAHYVITQVVGLFKT